MTRIDYLAKLPKQSIGAEVGVLEGEFSAEILKRCKVAQLYLIDPWKHYKTDYNDPANVDQAGQDQRYERVKARFGDDPRVTVIRAESRSGEVRDALQRLDWAFLDANHSYIETMADLSYYSTIADLLMVHDYCENALSKQLGWGVMPAVDNWRSYSGWKKVLVTEEEWPTVVLRKP